MTIRTETGTLGVLGTLSPEMARDIGEAFSLEHIGERKVRDKHAIAQGSKRGALRMAGQIVAFLVVSTLAISLAVAALLLLQL